MISTASEAVEFIKRRFQEPQGFLSSLMRGKRLETQIAHAILSPCSLPILERLALVQVLRREFLQKTITPIQYEALKKAFCVEGSVRNWKDAILSVCQSDQIFLHFIFFKYSNGFDQLLDREARVRFFLGEKISSVLGSTFVTNKPERIDTQGHHLLDATASCICLDKEKTFQGFALALGDGAGGHFGDLMQDKQVARASHFATKSSTRMMAAYLDPETLLKDLPTIIQAVRQEIKEKSQGESTTLVSCRIFPTSFGYRLIGFNIGDNLMVAWHPLTRSVYPLFSSHVSEAGTALIPEAYRSFEVQTIDIHLPKASLVFLMSDGVHDLLPYIETDGIYPNGLKYRARTLTHLDKIFETLPSDAPSCSYLEIIVENIMQKIEALKIQEQHNLNVQIGDDFSLLVCELR